MKTSKKYILKHIIITVFLVFVFIKSNFQDSDKFSKKTESDDSLSSIHLCTEILPEPIIEEMQKDSMKRMGMLADYLWPVGTTVLNIQFIGGEEIVKNKVIEVAKIWENYCGIVFQFGIFEHPDIIISFQKGGSWSRIGKSSRNHSPSMNFGWLDSVTPQEEYNRVVLHEFGHALGCIHEHQNPNNNPIKWNKPKVYEYYEGPPNNWSTSDVDHNIFDRYDKDEIRGSQFDSKSIMLYSIPAEMTLDGFSVGWNSDLSNADKNFIGFVYPK